MEQYRMLQKPMSAKSLAPELQQFFQVTSMDPVLLQPDTGKRLYQSIAGLSFRLPQKVIRPCHVR